MEHQLPADYLQYLLGGGVDDGFTDLEFARYFKLESIDSIDRFNADIEIDEYAPGFTAFASNGGGEFLAFDRAGVIYSIPLIGMSAQDAIRVSASWSDFVTHIQSSA